MAASLSLAKPAPWSVDTCCGSIRLERGCFIRQGPRSACDTLRKPLPMPIKLPKSFARRKSSGNALEEVENPPEPSFRVFERPASGSKSFDGSHTVKRMGEAHPSHSPTEDHDNLFAGFERPAPKNRYVTPRWIAMRRAALTRNRGSGGTNNSGSTGGLYDSSSSARFSSSSTLPSSTDVPVHDASNPHSRAFHDIPPPPSHGSQSSFSLRAAGRTFSFGTKPPKAPTPQPQPPSPTLTRDRAMTTSTASTATPPKLPHADLNLGGPDDDFGNMFEGLGKRKSALLQEQSVSPHSANTVRAIVLCPCIYIYMYIHYSIEC